MAERKFRESSELAAFLRRMARALVRRATEGDLDALSALVDARKAIDTAIKEAARALYDDGNGYTWSAIGGELGITKQAAQKRFGEED